MAKKQSPKKPKIKDIAVATGFSSAAVSYALSGNGRVSSETRDVVLKVAERIGFIRDASAVRLRSGRSNLLGAIINDMSNPFFSELLADFEDQAYAQGYLTIVANSKDDLQRQSVLLKSLAAQGIAGLLICPVRGSTAATFNQMSSRGLPMVVCVRDVGDHVHDYVGFNDHQAGYLAAKHLIRSGAKHIAFIGGFDHTQTWLDRRSGLLAALKEANITSISTMILPGPPTREFGDYAMTEVRSRFPNCNDVVCFNDYVALGAYISSHRVGLVVGRDVSIIGIDNVPLAASLHPPLTTVELFPRTAGRICAQIMDERLQSKPSLKKRILIEPELVTRESVKPVK